jgi:hypothetical protein
VHWTQKAATKHSAGTSTSARSQATAAQQEENAWAMEWAKSAQERATARVTASGTGWHEAMEVPRSAVPLHAPCMDQHGGSRSSAWRIQKLKTGSSTSTCTVIRQ